MGCDSSRPGSIPNNRLTHIFTEQAIEYRPYPGELSLTLCKSEHEIGEHFLFDQLQKDNNHYPEYLNNTYLFNNMLLSLSFKKMMSREEAMRIFILNTPKKFFEAGVVLGFPYEYRWWAYKAILNIKKAHSIVIDKMVSEAKNNKTYSIEE